MAVFFHEIGHSLFGWIFGYASIPTFDFEHGGGMAYHGERSWPIQIGVYLAALYGLYHIRISEYSLLFIPLLVLALALAAVSLTDWHEAIILFMGHGSEAAIGSYLLTRAFFNVNLVRPEERWLNAFIGGFFQLNLMKMCWQLIYDADYKFEYNLQKGGDGFGDLSRIAHDFTYGWSVDGVALFLWAYTIFITFAVPTFIYVVGIRKS